MGGRERSLEHRPAEPRRTGWHRRVGTFPRAGFGLYPGGGVLDGGRDAPLDERGLKIWHLALAATLALGCLILLLSVLTYVQH
jgi:hypothetical protein